jgi:hypothetical protein
VLSLALPEVSDQAMSNLACLSQSFKALQYEADVLRLARLLLPSGPMERADLLEGAKAARRLSRLAEAAAAGGDRGEAEIDTQPTLLQAEIAWRLGNQDQTILFVQKAMQLSPSNHGGGRHSIKVMSMLIARR